jgi:hypothetical protein
MRNVKVLTVLLAAGLALSGPLVAHAKKGGGGGESQKADYRHWKIASMVPMP